MTTPQEDLKQVKRSVSINYTSTGKVGFGLPWKDTYQRKRYSHRATR